jgi:predicted AlkP superfamily phosphohydrolase/phosphomutase
MIKQLPFLLIAVDGATFDYLGPAMENGYAPVLSELIEKGVAADLKSTFPPISSPAWVTFQTGRGPGELGYSDFFVKTENSYSVELASSKSGHPTLWDHLSKDGKRIGVVAMHLTYPPDPVNGFMVSPVYATTGDYYYPPEFKQTVESRIGYLDYEVADREKYYHDTFAEHTRLERNRLLLAKTVWEAGEERFDFFACGFNVDRAHHYLGDHEQMLQCYRLIDEVVAELVAVMKPANVMIVSDHGCGPTRGRFKPNQWLAKAGYLHYKTTSRSITRSARPPLVVGRRVMMKLLDALGVKQRLKKSLPDSLVKATTPTQSGYLQMLDEIDWSRTVAFAPVKEGIFLNIAGREPQGSVDPADRDAICDEIIKKLTTELVDPYTGKQLKIEAYKREEIYSGKNLDRLPDIVFFVPDYLESLNCDGPVFEHIPLMPPLPGKKVGGHTNNGIFIASGALFDSRKTLNEASLIDVPSTILSAMGVAVPADFEGQVLDVFYPEHQTVTGVASVETAVDRPAHTRTEGDEEVLMDLLRKLGYVE